VPGRVHLSLEVQAELLMRERAPQIVLDMQSLLHGSLHVGQKELGGIAAAFLSPVHGRVSLPQDVVRTFLPQREQGDSDAWCNVQLVLVQPVRPRQGGPDFVRDPTHLVRRHIRVVADVRQEYDERVAAKPSYGILLARQVPQARCHQPLQLVSCRMSEGVVDGLEVIQIVKQHSPLVSLTQKRLEAALDTVHE